MFSCTIYLFDTLDICIVRKVENFHLHKKTVVVFFGDFAGGCFKLNVTSSSIFLLVSPSSSMNENPRTPEQRPKVSKDLEASKESGSNYDAKCLTSCFRLLESNVNRNYEPASHFCAGPFACTLRTGMLVSLVLLAAESIFQFVRAAVEERWQWCVWFCSFAFFDVTGPGEKTRKAYLSPTNKLEMHLALSGIFPSYRLSCLV